MRVGPRHRVLSVVVLLVLHIGCGERLGTARRRPVADGDGGGGSGAPTDADTPGGARPSALRRHSAAAGLVLAAAFSPSAAGQAWMPRRSSGNSMDGMTEDDYRDFQSLAREIRHMAQNSGEVVPLTISDAVSPHSATPAMMVGTEFRTSRDLGEGAAIDGGHSEDAELVKCLLRMGEAAAVLFAVADLDSDGCLVDEEYLSHMSTRTENFGWGSDFDVHINFWASEVFDRSDLERDGVLSPEEYAYAECLVDSDIRRGQFAERYLITRLFELVDLDGDGRITPEEAQAAPAHELEPDEREAFARVLGDADIFDFDEDGALSRSEADELARQHRHGGPMLDRVVDRS